MYLAYQVEDECEKEFSNLNIDLLKLDGLGENKRPVAISIEKLMKSKIKQSTQFASTIKSRTSRHTDKVFFKIELTKPSQKKHWIKKYTKQKGRGINQYRDLFVHYFPFFFYRNKSPDHTQ